MKRTLRKVKKTVDKTIPDRRVLTHKEHPILDWFMLVFRNMFVGMAVIFFLGAFFFDDVYHMLKGIGYFFGAGAYVVECLLITNYFKVKVPHSEMFMVYCFGPLYIIMGLGYVFH